MERVGNGSGAEQDLDRVLERVPHDIRALVQKGVFRPRCGDDPPAASGSASCPKKRPLAGP
jgi:hypothetical protein